VEVEPLRESPVEGVEEPGAAAPSPAEQSAVKAVGAPGPSVKEVIAPMPGNIMDIRVGVSDRVSYKQELCNLEAMKMKNSIRSPREGVIAAVKVREGQTVGYGEVLFIFE
jgi:biotin carboxyl carrier protein